MAPDYICILLISGPRITSSNVFYRLITHFISKCQVYLSEAKQVTKNRRKWGSSLKVSDPKYKNHNFLLVSSFLELENTGSYLKELLTDNS